MPKEEQGWKSIRKWANIWRSANSVQQIRKWRAYCDPCTTTVFIADDRHPSDHHASNFSYNSQVLRRKHPVLGIKLNPLSLLFQLARYHHNNTNKRLQNKGFRSLQRHHMFSVALCIMRMRAWRLARVFCSHDPEARVFFGFLWQIEKQLVIYAFSAGRRECIPHE